MGIFLLVLTIICFRVSDSLPARTPNVTVDNSKSGNARNYTGIQKAIDDAPSGGAYRYVIYIRKGNYLENITVSKEKNNITLVGDGKDHTIISSNLSNKTGHSIQEATVIIHGSGFLAMDLAITNIAGAEGMQAVALLSNSPYSAFYHVSIRGYQDTLYIKAGPQLFTECDVYGTVDFIFGEGPAVFQKCRILARQSPIRKEQKENAITANGCIYKMKATCGFSFHRCDIDGDTDLRKSRSRTPTFLGRTWKNGSKTIFMESSISQVVNPKGWLKWSGKDYEKTVFLAEFNNSGNGSAIQNRVNWKGVHSSLKKKKAQKYTVEEFLNGKQWLPKLNISYIPYLL